MKWIIDVRPMVFEKPHTCEFCEISFSKYWIEELAFGICEDCYNYLNKECKNEKRK